MYEDLLQCVKVLDRIEELSNKVSYDVTIQKIHKLATSIKIKEIKERLYNAIRQQGNN